jgi:hypothetical protein
MLAICVKINIASGMQKGISGSLEQAVPKFHR